MKKKICIFKSTDLRSITNRIDIFRIRCMNENEQIIIIFKFPEPRAVQKIKMKTEPMFYWRFSPLRKRIRLRHLGRDHLVSSVYLNLPYLTYSLHSGFCMRNCIIAFCNLSWIFAVRMHNAQIHTPQVRLPYLFTHVVPLTYGPYGPFTYVADNGI